MLVVYLDYTVVVYFDVSVITVMKENAPVRELDYYYVKIPLSEIQQH